MIAALFVPLSECSRGEKPPTTPVPSRTLLQKIFPRSDAQTDYDYGAARLGLSINGIATLIAFGWPLVLALMNQSIAEKRVPESSMCSSSCCAGTICWIHIATLAGKRLWAHTSCSPDGRCAIAALVDLASGRRHKFARQTGF